MRKNIDTSGTSGKRLSDGQKESLSKLRKTGAKLECIYLAKKLPKSIFMDPCADGRILKNDPTKEWNGQICDWDFFFKKKVNLYPTTLDIFKVRSPKGLL